MKKINLNNNCFKTALVALGIFVAVALCVALNPMTVAYAADDVYYRGGSYLATDTETVNFSRIEVEEGYINSSFPAYYNTNTSLHNSCANVAGAIILGYYDRYFDNLIPDFTAGLLRAGNYTYKSMAAGKVPVQNVINALYTDMRTNTTGAGTSKTQYNDGLRSYVSRKGQSISYSSAMTSGALDIGKVKAAVMANTPISLFLTGYNITTMTLGANNIKIEQRKYSGNHVMIVYGYKIIKYYDSSNLGFRTDIFLQASTGEKEFASQLYLVGGYGAVNDAESAYIY